MTGIRVLLVVVALFFYSNQQAKAQGQEGVELAVYIENLRQQFIQLASSGQSDALPLYVSPIEIELTVAVVNTGSAGIKFYVIDAGGSVSASSTQRLKFTVSIGDPNEPFLAYDAPTVPWQPYGSVTRVPVPGMQLFGLPEEPRG